MRTLFSSITIAACLMLAMFILSQTIVARASDTENFAAATPTCTPLNIILDGGFEAGGVPSALWIDPQTSTNFGTPLCTEATCGTGSGAAPPRSGLTWAWFGGIPLPETAKLGQNVTIPTGTASLHFWMRIGTVTSPFTDVLNIKIDNVTVQSYTEPSIAETGYTERIVDLSAFADGGLHNIQFEYIGPSNGTGSYVIDDVTLLASGAGCASPSATPTSTPTATGTPTCTPSDHIVDGTFEAGNPWTAWTVQTSTIFGTPICNTAICGTDSGTASPFAGDNWIWFGGIAAAETATVGQSVIIPSGAPATLTFRLRIGKVITPFTDTLTVNIDGTTLTTFTEPASAETSYTLRTFDVSSFADGASHAILFTYTGTTTGASNFTVDNVSLIAGGVCSTPTPSNTPTNTPTATPSAMISGTITYGNAITGPPPPFVSNVLINGVGSANVSTTTVFPNGNYSLSGFGSGSYIVTPSKTGGVNGSITSFDAGRIAQHVAGIIVLNANQLIAADVSGNGSISSFDAAQIARYTAAVAGSGSTGNWIFVPANRNYPNITGVLSGEDYVAYLMGEVSGNWANTAR
ncbi:MAG: dockerin type I repeat-containing protein [Chloracidobacterium sp.]|nr:dockerin type I repeat-containing protein [Chloracidobacterium sp.]